MRIVVIGGTGRIGSKLVHSLTEHGHDAIAAAPSTGVNTLTGEGLADAVKGADVVVDVSNSPTLDGAAKAFFNTATPNILAAEAAAGVAHHVALSVVGTEILARDSEYFEAKLAQEKLIGAGPVPYTIVRATQFYDFLGAIADASAVGDTIHLPSALIQPMAPADVAEAVAIAAVGAPVNGITEVGGPQAYTLPAIISAVMAARGDSREVLADPDATYWGIHIDERTLVPGADAALFDTRFEDWLSEAAARA
jgi:uncharacterized protein YbjT (DUF2867 family)